MTAGYDFLAGELVKRDAEIEQLRAEIALLRTSNANLRAALQQILDDVEPAARNGASGAISVRAIVRTSLAAAEGK